MSKLQSIKTVFTIAIIVCVTIWATRIFSPPEPASATHVAGPALTDFSSPSSEAGASILSAPAFITMNVSAYCLCEKCCGIWAEKGKINGVRVTASGRPAVGRICAAPPEYPFGTVFEVEGYGEYVVQDRGGAIKGNKLDLLMDSHGKAILFGRQWLKVRIVR